MVLLKDRKDEKLTTLGGRLFQATATRSLKRFYGTDLQHLYTDYHVYIKTDSDRSATYDFLSLIRKILPPRVCTAP